MKPEASIPKGGLESVKKTLLVATGWSQGLKKFSSFLPPIKRTNNDLINKSIELGCFFIIYF
jgi:hypothetical protein